MLAVESRHPLDNQHLCPSVAAPTPRSAVAARRARGVSRRRPAGQFVEYGSVPISRSAARPSSAPSKARVRVRVALLGVFVMAVVAGGAFGLASAMGADTTAVPTQTGVAQVHQGETLSGVAARVAPQAQRAATVRRIVQLNGLSGVSIRAGQTLVVPTGG
ncbi:MAG: LysM peptidoglycan-binding domain-containing protein [Mycobacteriaceae bacterium]